MTILECKFTNFQGRGKIFWGLSGEFDFSALAQNIGDWAVFDGHRGGCIVHQGSHSIPNEGTIGIVDIDIRAFLFGISYH